MTPEQKQRANERHKVWRDANRDKLREKARERSRKFYATRRDEALAASANWRENNREASRVASKTWREKYPEKARDLNLKKYGITGAQWDVMFASQNHACAACQSADPRSKRGWHTDHDHDTGKVRGILCHPCNTVLGLLGDSVERVNETAISLCRYLGGVSFNPDSNSRSDDDLLFYV